MPGIDNFSQQVQGSSDPTSQQQLPFLMRAAGANPFQFGVTAQAGHNASRFANTMFEGGFLDVGAGATGKRAAVKRALGKRTGAYAGNAMQDNSAYAMGATFRKNMPSWTGKMGKSFEEGGRKIKAQMANYPLNPKAFRRFDSVARLAGDATQKGVYTPFQGMSFLAERGFANKGRLGQSLRGRFANDFDAATGELLDGKTLYTGGVFGRINTMGKVMDYEKQVAAATAAPTGSVRAQARVARRAEKAAAKLEQFDENIVRLGKQTGANFAKAGASEHLTEASMRTFGTPIHLTDDMITGAMQSGAADAKIGAAAQRAGRLRALSETNAGVVSRRITDYFGTMMGGGAQFEGTQAFTNVANTFSQAMEGSRFGGLGAGALDDAAHEAKSLWQIATKSSGYMDDATNLLKAGDAAAIRKTAAKLGTEAFARGEYKMAGKMAGHYLGTGGKFAGQAFGALGTASMVYDIGKGVGKMIMGGVNLGKDALKSMQGSLNKPLFGAGFKDNEVAATSRSRGVMAIQNSRLNARSALGSEGAMMAAHFG